MCQYLENDTIYVQTPKLELKALSIGKKIDELGRR